MKNAQYFRVKKALMATYLKEEIKGEKKRLCLSLKPIRDGKKLKPIDKSMILTHLYLIEEFYDYPPLTFSKINSFFIEYLRRIDEGEIP